MSRLAVQVRDYLDGALSEAELDEMLSGLARQVLEASRPLPGAPALVTAPGHPPAAVAAGIVEEELDRVARLVTPVELDRLCDQLALLLGGMPAREPDSLGPLRRPDYSGVMQARGLALMDGPTGGPGPSDARLKKASVASDTEELDRLSGVPESSFGALGGAGIPADLPAPAAAMDDLSLDALHSDSAPLSMLDAGQLENSYGDLDVPDMHLREGAPQDAPAGAPDGAPPSASPVAPPAPSPARAPAAPSARPPAPPPPASLAPPPAASFAARSAASPAPPSEAPPAELSALLAASPRQLAAGAPPAAEAPPPEPPAAAPAVASGSGSRSRAASASRPPSDQLTGASIAPPMPRAASGSRQPAAVLASGPASGGSTLPAKYLPVPAAFAVVVDGVVPAGLVLVLLRNLVVLARGGALVAGGVAWLVAAIAYAGRVERLRSDEEHRAGAGGSSVAAIAAGLLFLLSLVK